MYGLGGHTGPDLTNIMQRRSGDYVRAMMTAGPEGMPSYRRLSPDQTEAIIDYLSSVGSSIAYPAYPSATWLGPLGERSP